jgi:hypothetical protein
MCFQRHVKKTDTQEEWFLFPMITPKCTLKKCSNTLFIIIKVGSINVHNYYYYHHYYRHPLVHIVSFQLLLLLFLLYQLPHDNMTALYFNIGSSSFLCIILRCTDCHVAYRFCECIVAIHI